MRLDVGCGTRPQGDVNCDLFVGESPHIEKGGAMNPKTIPNFVRCDALYLPFKPKTFNETISSHTIEHLNDPTKAVNEMIRVTEGKITIIVPHRYARTSWFRYKQNPMHKHFFSVKSLETWLRKIGLNPIITVSYRAFPHPCFSLIRLPWEMKAEINQS